VRKFIFIAIWLMGLVLHAQTQPCVPANGMQCTPNLNLYLPPANYLNWNLPMNSNSQIIDSQLCPKSGCTLTGPIVGTLTGHATLDLPLAGGALTGTLVAPQFVAPQFYVGGAPGTVMGTFPIDPQPLQNAIDAAGNMWVTSAVTSTVVELSPTGTVLNRFHMAIPPDCSVIDQAGFIWLCNQNVDSISKMNPSTGAVIGTYAVGAAPDNLAIDQQGNVWVATSGTNAVTELSSTGTLIGNWPTGSGNPWNVAIDAGGNCWTGNFFSNTMSKISATGQLLGVFTVGTHPQVFAIDSAGNVWVPNEESGSVMKLSPMGTLLLTAPVADTGLGGLVIDGSGNVWVYGAAFITELNPAGQTILQIPSPTHPAFESIDSQGYLWISSYDNATMTKIATGAKGVVTPLVSSLFPGNPFNLAVYSHTGTLISTPHIVTDATTLSGGTIVVTFTGGAAFGATLHCTANDITAANPVRVVNLSFTQVQFTGTGSDMISYSCIGN
jgi:sugar lactone lactonase YvrE